MLFQLRKINPNIFQRVACTACLHDRQRISRVLSQCLPQALALRGIGQRAHHESVQAHAHLLGIFFELPLERAG